MDVDDFAPRLSFFLDVHNDFFEEIAKFRAARRIWAHIMRERFGAKDPRSMQLRTHAQTAGVSLTAQQPYNNVVRTALQALAAVLGGTQSLHTNSLDETYALPTEEAVTIALRTQQIIAHESGVDRVVDPLGGSYFVEYLTDEMEKRALEYIRRIDEMGGIVRAVEEGYPQREIGESAYRFQREVEQGERLIVGVNAFKREQDDADRAPQDRRAVAAGAGRRGSSRCKAERDAAAVSAALAKVEAACRGTREPDAAGARGGEGLRTLGEISRRVPQGLGPVPGRWDLLNAGVPALPFTPSSRMPDRKLRILVAKPGLDGHDRGAKIIARALRDAGMEVIYTGLHQTPEMIVNAAIQEDVDAIGLSIMSGAHMTLFPAVIDLLKGQKAEDIEVFGGGIIPDDDIPQLKQLGVSEIFTPGSSTQDIVQWIRQHIQPRAVSWLGALPARVDVYEVGPRDGLQNELRTSR